MPCICMDLMLIVLDLSPRSPSTPYEQTFFGSPFLHFCNDCDHFIVQVFAQSSLRP